jgi:hypothetical protein
VRASLREMPRLLAEESIQQVRQIGVGTGLLGDTGQQLHRQWVAIARPNEAKPDLHAARASAIAAAGVKVFRDAGAATD